MSPAVSEALQDRVRLGQATVYPIRLRRPSVDMPPPP